MSYMLVDDPQTVSSGGDNEAVVDLPQGTEILQGLEALGLGQVRIGKQRPVRLRNSILDGGRRGQIGTI